MSDERKPPEPFMLLTGAQSHLPPRSGPTMVGIRDGLDKVEALGNQLLKRQQQTAMMVDGFASAVNRRFDVLHEEVALLRVTQNRPANDTDATLPGLDVTVVRSPGERARSVIALTGKLAAYGTTIAIGLRLVAKQFPEYQATIDELLGVFGL